MRYFAVVGLFDSLLDVPRLGWLFYLLLMVALTLRGETRETHATRQAGDAQVRQPARAARAAAGLAWLAVACGIVFHPVHALAGQADQVQQIIRVGPSRAIKTIAEASYKARAGAIIEVDSGEYRADVAVWTQDRITVHAVGGARQAGGSGRSRRSQGHLGGAGGANVGGWV